jgi:hypothetical protein
MILVDPTREYESGPRGWKLWCHMATDDLSEEGFRELHRMAERLGLPRRAFQQHPRHPHDELSPDRRALAVALGAEQVSSKELVRRCSVAQSLGEGE